MDSKPGTQIGNSLGYYVLFSNYGDPGHAIFVAYKFLLSVKNSEELGSSPFPYIAPVIPRLLPGEVVGGEHFVLVDLLKSI